ncbi:hypothetical protein ABIF65_009201 [Bradyrhizobium japonicum]|jgi:hypothetical protein|nr:hypothetical protein [Bradyrhizobium japonicum]MCP1774784.1 hypothetical protein [Bradyrhizobium japonicum]MCP1865463.1 hypothetical protein [Bradyrhizobium japonicum]MCP1895766.1 hypothetical protein [Bradyrhizobium japonicum]MCP1962216.1 hypothetical protein [Bradyrhizobium japonicum]
MAEQLEVHGTPRRAVRRPNACGAFTQPILRLDLDRIDDNDNRLFGITAQIAWMPKPADQMTLRTPLYPVRSTRN